MTKIFPNRYTQKNNKDHNNTCIIGFDFITKITNSKILCNWTYFLLLLKVYVNQGKYIYLGTKK